MDMNIVVIPWRRGDTISSWDEMCAMIVERFGLPGSNFTTKITEHNMTFEFKDAKDATMCRLLLSEQL